MKKLCLYILLFVSLVTPVHATVKQDVNNLRASTEGIGYFGEIITTIFDEVTGKIKNAYLYVIGDDLEDDNIPRWDSDQLVKGSITDDGGGDIAVDGDITANAINADSICNASGGNCTTLGGAGGGGAFGSLWSIGTGDEIYYNVANVGIGTTNPSEKLEVDGNIELTNQINFTRGADLANGPEFAIRVNSDNAEFIEPEQGNKVWARFVDDQRLELIGTPNLLADGTIAAKGNLFAEGTVTALSNPTNGNHVGNRDYNDARYINSLGGGINGDDITDGTIDSTEIEDNTLTNQDIADGTIRTQELADNSVTSSKIVDGTIIGDDIALGTIGSQHLGSGAIDGSSLSQNSVTSSHIVDGTISADDLGTNSVGNDELIDNPTFTNVISNAPTAANHLTTKSYVDDLVGGISWKEPTPSSSSPSGTYGACNNSKQGWATYNKSDNIIYICNSSSWVNIGSTGSIPYATTSTAGRLQIAGDITGTWNNIQLKAGSVGSNEIEDNSITSSDLGANSVTSSELADNSVSSSNIINNSITSDDLGSNSVTSSELANNSVNSSNIIDGSISGDDIAAGAIDGSNIGAGEINSTHILDNSLTSDDLGINSVTSSELANNSVGSNNIINNSITSDDLGSNSVTSSELADNSVGGANIINNSITANDLATNSVGNDELIDNPTFTNPIVSTPTSGGHAVNKSYVDNLVNGLTWKDPVDVSPSATYGACTAAKESWATYNKTDKVIYVCNGTAWVQMSSSVGTPNLAGEVTGPITATVVKDNIIDGANIINNSLTASDLAADSVGASELGNNSVSSANIIDGSITANDIAAGAITGANIGAGEITSTHILDNSITSADILNGTITGSDIASNTITASDLAADSVGASELANNSVASANIIDNSITGADILNNTITESDISDSFKARDSDKLDGVDSTSFLRADQDDLLYEKIIVGSTNNRRAGMYGSYNSTRVGHIWSMGTAYQIPENGANFGNLYGLAYKHTNNATGGAMAGGHQGVWAQNGVGTAAIGTNIWTSGAYKSDGVTVIGSDAWIEGDRIRQNTVDGSEIQDNSLTASDLAADSVGASELANNSVASANVIDNSLTASDLAANSVGNSELIDNPTFTNVISNSPTANNHLTTKQYVDDLVTTGVIWKAPVDIDAATTYGICNASKEGWATYNKSDKLIYICNGTAWVQISSSVGIPNLAGEVTGSLTNNVVANNTIDSANIKDNTLTASDLAANSVGNSELIDNPTVNTIYAPNWFRSTGASGWYNQSYGGGLYMSDTSWIRTYGGKNFYSDRMIRADNGFQVDGVQVIGGDAWIEGDRIRQNTIDSGEIQNNTVASIDILDNTVSSTDILNNTITETDISDSFKARDSDLLDGYDSSDFLIKDKTSAKTINAGWYTIAKNSGNRASAKFIIRETRSGSHQSVHFYAQHHYGTNGSNVINVLADSAYGGGGSLRYLRIKDGSTYQGAVLQVYVDASSTPVYGEMLENIQSSGWTMVDWAADGTQTSPNESLLSEVTRIDLDVDNGIQTTAGINANNGFKVDGTTVIGGDAWIEGDRIRQNTIDGGEIQNNSLTASDLAADSVGASELANNSVASANIIDNSVTGADILNNTITETDISDSFVARDSDKVDGIQATSFLRSDANDSASGRLTLNGNVGIGINARTDSYKLAIGGPTHVNNQDINYVNQLHFHDNVRLYDDGNDSYLNFKYGDSAGGGIKISDGNSGVQGYVYSGGNNADFGLLDKDGNWAVRTVRDSYVELRDNNEASFSAGQGGVSGTYGTVETKGSGKNGYEGYSINGRYALMSADSNAVGLYNDIDNEWMLYGARNGAMNVYHNGVNKLQTTSAGINVSGTVTASTPTSATHLTTKQYVDDLVNGLSWKPPVDVDAATTYGSCTTAKESWATYNKSDNIIYVCNGSAWVQMSSTVGIPNLAGEVTGPITSNIVANNTIDSANVKDNSLTASDLAANSVGNSELIDIPTVTQLNLAAGTGYGVRFWSSDSYEIAMGNSSDYRYGPVQDYSIKMNMSNTAARGWTWGVAGTAPKTALNTGGNFQTAGSVRAEGGFNVDGTTVIGGDAWIEGDRIRQGTIDGGEIQNNSLTASDLAADSVGASELANNSVASANVIDNTLTANDLAPNSVGDSELIDNPTFSTIDFNKSGIVHYKNLAHYNGNPITGVMKITMAKSWSNTMSTTTIKGYNYNAQGAWEVIVSGYNYTSTDWYNASAEIRGDAPFNRVRLSHDGSRNIILLGTTSTSWSYPKVVVSDFVAGHSSITGWESGWTIAVQTNESGFNSTTEPALKTYLATNGNFGIGDTTPEEKLRVNGRISIATDPNSADDVGDRGYNDARYINVGESGDSIADNTIDGSEIQNDSLTASDLAANSVGASELADNSVGSANVIANSLTASDLAADSVGASELANNSVASANVIDNSLTASDLAANSVGNSELKNTENLYINNIYRSAHNKGHLVGSYNSVGANSAQSNPIYSIGSSYMPGTTALNNFYGIGYSHGNASFTPSGVGWGAYVAADGDARHFLDGSNGQYWNSGGIKVDSRVVVGSDGWTEGDNIRQNTIDGSEIQDNTLTASDLAADSVGASELANNSVASANVIDNSLTASDLAPNSVGSSELIASPAFTNPTVATPTSGTHAANKSYVDNLVNGLTWKPPVTSSPSATYGTCTAAKESWTTFNKADNIIYVCNGSAWVQMSSSVGIPNLAGEVTGSITSNVVANNTIDSANVKDNTLTASDLAANSVGNSELIDNPTVSTLYLGTTDTSLFRDTANRIATDDSFYVRAASPATYLYSTNTYLGNSSGDTTHLRGNNFTWNQGIIQGNGSVGIGDTTPEEKLRVNGRISISTDPNSADDVGDRGYNDARYINVGESGDSIGDNTIDGSEIQNDSLTASDLAANSVGASELQNTGNFTMNDLITNGNILATDYQRTTSGGVDTYENVVQYYAGNVPTGMFVIKIGNTPNTMIDAEISVQGYNGLQKFHVRGYTYASQPGWHQPVASCVRSGAAGNCTVRFGREASTGDKVILLGTPTTNWGSYPHAVVNRVSVGYGSGLGTWTITRATSDAAYASLVTAQVNNGFVAYNPNFTGGVRVNGTSVINSSAYVLGDRIEQNSIDNSELAADSVGASELANNSVASANVIANSLTASDLAANSVGNSELVDDITVNYVRGLNYLYGDYGTIARSTDEWLRLNDGNSHTNGVYIGNMLRADGGLRVSDDEGFYRGGEDIIDTDDAFVVNNRLSVGVDPNSGDDVGDRDYNDARYINVGENISVTLSGEVTGSTSNTIVANDIIDSANVKINSLTASDLAANSVGNSELIDNPTVSTLYLGTTDTSLFRDTANRIATDDSFYVRSASPATYLYSTNTYLGAGSGDTTHLRGNNLTWNQGVIQGNGSVGIGDTTPEEKLRVNGRISISTDPNSADDVGDRGYNDARYINVGEAVKVTLAGEVTGPSNATIIADNTIDSNNVKLNSLTDADLAPNSVGNSELIANPTFTNPIVATPILGIHVANKSYVDSKSSPWLKNGTKLYYNTNNVGIGTFSPTAKLEVAGRIAVSGLGESTFLGKEAGLNDDGTDNRNTAIGYNSLRANTSGFFNVANGYGSLQMNTTGVSNTANGMNVLNMNTTGAGNTGVGASALDDNTTGSFNTAVGYVSLFNNTTGTYNTALGEQTLFSNQTGTYNTAIGREALISANLGTNNTGLGNQAGTNNSPFKISSHSNRIVLGNNSITNAYIKVGWTVTSDMRDKTDFKDDVYGLDFIKKLRPVTYNRDERSYYEEKGIKKDGSLKDDKREIGFLAQDVVALEKEFGAIAGELLIADDEQDEKLKIKETSMIPVLVKGIQEQQDEIDNQGEALDEQQDKITELLKIVKDLQKEIKVLKK